MLPGKAICAMHFASCMALVVAILWPKLSAKNMAMGVRGCGKEFGGEIVKLRIVG